MTLSLYVLRRFFVSFLTVFLLISLLYGLLDMIEVVRRFDQSQMTIWTVFAMTALRTVEGVYNFLPFVVLLSTLALFMSLARRSELVVVRSAGRSVMRLLLAPVAGAALLGLLMVTTFNPIVAIAKVEYERLSQKYLQGSASVLSVSSDGLWLRQGSDAESAVIRAQGALLDGTVLQDVSFFGFDRNGIPIYRIEAETAALHPGEWRIDTYRKWDFDDQQALSPHPETGDRMTLASPLTLDQIRDGLGTPASISFWSLPGFIDRLEQAGFSARRHAVWYQSELARPILLVASMLIGAMLVMRHTRAGGNGMLVVATLLIGFGFFFLRNFAILLGENGQLPIALAVWAVPSAAILMSIAVILHLEDG